jgi:adenylyl cyclase-associated protein
VRNHRDTKHTEWVQSYYAIFRELSGYVKQHFSNGIIWDPKGLPAKEVAKSLNSVSVASPAPAAPAGGAPPPPPPPPPGPPPVIDIKKEAASPSQKSSGFGAVFSELNKGESVTKGLRKVDKSEMTHKNPALRAGSTVSDSGSTARGKSPAPGKKPKPESMRVKKPSKKELEGNKWTIVSSPTFAIASPPSPPELHVMVNNK